jgi:hypothetical protein
VQPKPLDSGAVEVVLAPEVPTKPNRSRRVISWIAWQMYFFPRRRQRMRQRSAVHIMFLTIPAFRNVEVAILCLRRSRICLANDIRSVQDIGITDKLSESI